MDNEKKIALAFAATGQYVQRAIPENRSLDISGREFWAWGKDNKYPEFLYMLYKESPTLQAVINGFVDYVLGNGIEGWEPSPGMELVDMVAKVVCDYAIYGVGYVNVIRDKSGREVEAYWMDARRVRTNEDNTVFFYSEDWSKSYGRVKTVVLPKYMEGATEASSVIMIKTPQSRETYPIPIWNSAVRAATTEVEISKYHLNEIVNNFAGSAIINFNNGVPTDEQKDEIEQAINDKFTGSENAGRFLLSFNDNKENQTTIARLATDNYADRYNSLEKTVRQSIFTAFRANPNLFGIPTENLGFSNEEYESAFELFNRTMVKPVQRMITRIFERIGKPVSITPFTLANNNTDNQVEA